MAVVCEFITTSTTVTITIILLYIIMKTNLGETDQVRTARATTVRHKAVSALGDRVVTARTL